MNATNIRILESVKIHYKQQIEKFAEMIKWNSDSTAETLSTLLADAKMGKDVGYDNFAKFYDADCFHDWVMLAQIATCLYNRDHLGDAVLLCVIRMDNIYMLSTIGSLF